MDSGEVPVMPLPPDLRAFKRLIASYGNRKEGPSQKFVKKFDISLVELPAERICCLALNLAEHGLISQFIGLWPSPKAIEG